MSADSVRLSSMAHGGGCGCKLSPAVLAALLGNQSAAQPFRQLLVGTETGEVWRVTSEAGWTRVCDGLPSVQALLALD